MKELIGRLTDGGLQRSGSDRADIFLTGGAAPVVAQFLDPSAQLVPHLVLAGIALVAK
jgi:hypothetical protein